MGDDSSSFENSAVQLTLYPDTRREHHPAALHACEPPSRQCHQRVLRPSLRRPRTRFLPRSTRPHSPNPHLRCWTIPANLPIARPSLSVLRVQTPPYPRSGFFSEPVSGVRPGSSHRLSSCRGPSFSPPPFSRWASSSPISSSEFPSS